MCVGVCSRVSPTLAEISTCVFSNMSVAVGFFHCFLQLASMPNDVELFLKKQRTKIEEWCDLVPVLGFNSGRYDLNLIKEYFVERLAATTSKVRVAKKANAIMFMITPGFCFHDIINYFGPGTSYEK